MLREAGGSEEWEVGDGAVVPGECGCVGAAEGAGEGVWPFAAGVPGEDRFCQAVKSCWLEEETRFEWADLNLVTFVLKG